MAGNHLLKPMALSSKIVPTLTENCLRQSRQVHSIRVLINDSFLDSQRGHCGPLGHLALETCSRQAIGSEKYRIAASKPCFLLSLTVSMTLLYHGMNCESSDLLPKFAPRFVANLIANLGNNILSSPN